MPSPPLIRVAADVAARSVFALAHSEEGREDRVGCAGEGLTRLTFKRRSESGRIQTTRPNALDPAPEPVKGFL